MYLGRQGRLPLRRERGKRGRDETRQDETRREDSNRVRLSGAGDRRPLARSRELAPIAAKGNGEVSPTRSRSLVEEKCGHGRRLQTRCERSAGGVNLPFGLFRGGTICRLTGLRGQAKSRSLTCNDRPGLRQRPVKIHGLTRKGWRASWPSIRRPWEYTVKRLKRVCLSVCLPVWLNGRLRAGLGHASASPRLLVGTPAASNEARPAMQVLDNCRFTDHTKMRLTWGRLGVASWASWPLLHSRLAEDGSGCISQATCPSPCPCPCADLGTRSLVCWVRCIEYLGCQFVPLLYLR
ncbi:hypothetical protein F4780DRAFT_667879 [Xylariomycetidae sp. FL0641]|nr:hypothetical protein F4780DRAFT_667879 [Xylariomycetidae sp. FL0641]